MEEEVESNDLGQTESQYMEFLTRLCAYLMIENDFPEIGFFHALPGIPHPTSLNPLPAIASSEATDSKIIDMFIEEKEKLCQEMVSIPTKISLTFDLWLDADSERYLCLTAHFVDKNWKLNRKILNFSPLFKFDLPGEIIDSLEEWKIEDKILSLTFDDSFLDDTMQTDLKNQLVLQNPLLCDGDFFHVHCFGGTLSLMVKEGLEIASDVLGKIRESVDYVRGSKSRMKKFKECSEKVGSVDISVGLHSEHPREWNSTYLMLESALKYQHVFASLHLYDDNYKVCPSAEEWKRGGKIRAFLLPFYETTNMISGKSYPTSNLCFLQVWKILRVVVDSLRDEDKVVKSMAERMIGKIEKYWDQYSVLLALGAVLDPRMKFSTLVYCYSKVDASTCERKLEEVKRKMYMLFEKYSNQSTSSGVQSTVHTQTSSMRKKVKPLSHNLFGELKRHYQQLASETGKSELDVYLDEPNLNFRDNEDLDVLQWWKSNSNRFSDLSTLARDLLNIPITTVLSESLFNFGSCFLDKYSDRSVPDCVALGIRICTRNWMFGFVSNDEVDGNEEDYEGASNDFDMEDADDDDTNADDTNADQGGAATNNSYN